MTQPPWVYRPQAWDTEELKEEYTKHPTPDPPPTSIKVVVQEGPESSAPVKLSTTKTQLILEVGPPFQQYLYSDVRYVTTFCRAFTETNRYVILVSLRTPERPTQLANMFIKADTAESTLAILNFLQYHLFEYLRYSVAQEDPSVVQQYLRPLIVHPFRVTVHRRMVAETEEGRTLILVLDQECLSLYEARPYQNEPKYTPMFFWREQDDKSVSKVSRIKSANLILFQSPDFYIIVPYNQDMAPELERELSNVGKDMPRKAFVDPKVLLRCLMDEEVEDVEEHYDYEDPNFEPIKIDSAEENKISQLEQELQNGMREFLGSRSAVVWENQEPELKNLLRSREHLLPNVDLKDVNPNSVDNLLETIQRVEELLFRSVDFPKALATALSMRQLFLQSHVVPIRALIEREDPLNLLKKIYARGSKITRKAPSAPGDQLQCTYDEDIDMAEND